ncbi:hypothetical protein JNO04_15700 [Halomonas sp. MC140]|nr:hypothetical protein [Halomonas sp. MC140]MDN7133789.1 hypothetical protein [Halomonas sp. MC140]
MRRFGIELFVAEGGRDFDRQVTELQIRAAVLNGYTALGIPVTEPMAYPLPHPGLKDHPHR